jgi:hypothetical protein
VLLLAIGEAVQNAIAGEDFSHACVLPLNVVNEKKSCTIS